MEPTAVKYNASENMVAIRTTFPIDSPNAWGVMTADRGGHYMTDDDAQGDAWADVELPQADTE